MKDHKVCLVLVLVLLFGVATTSEASTASPEDSQTIYAASFTSAHQPIESNTQFTHTFMSVPAEGFTNLQGTLSFTWSPAGSSGGKGSKSASGTGFDVYIGDPDTPLVNWFQLADDFMDHPGRVSLKLTNEVLASILSDGNGNISFAIVPNSNVFLNSGSLRVSGTPVPIPGAAWLLGSGLLAMIGFRRGKQGS